MSISLPAVISAVAGLASVPEVSPPLLNPDPQDLKKVIIMITRDVSKEDRKLLSSFGVVKDYDDRVHLNLSLPAMAFDYLIVDMREKSDRLFYQKSVLGNTDYHQVLYKWSFETDMGLSFESEFSTFPVNQASKLAYDQLLCSPPITEPSACLSFLGAVASCAKS